MDIATKKKILNLIQHFFSHYDYSVRKIHKPEFKPVWPKSNVSYIEDQFLLLFTVPNSGSTAMAKFICQSNKVYGLEDNCELLYVLKGLWGDQSVTCAPFQYINYKSLAGILATKLKQFKQDYPEMEYVFEKSPDNVFRYKKLLEIIPNTRMVASNRNPYAHVASCLKRYDRFEDKNEQCRMHIHYWIVWSQHIKEACETSNIPLLTYERFCQDPNQLVVLFGLSENKFNKNYHINVKDYSAQNISNMNEKQIALLSERQKKIVHNALSGHQELLAYFDYERLE